MAETVADRSETDANRDESLTVPKFLADRRGIPTTPELVRTAKKRYRALNKLLKRCESPMEATKVHAEMTRLHRLMMEHAAKVEDNELADLLEQLGAAH